MAAGMKLTFLIVSLMLLTFAVLTMAKSIGRPNSPLYPSEFDKVSSSQMVEDDGTLDNALLNYLFARQMFRRMRNNMDITDLQKKRSYFKQCAFNAVTCFGKK